MIIEAAELITTNKIYYIYKKIDEYDITYFTILLTSKINIVLSLKYPVIIRN